MKRTVVVLGLLVGTVNANAQEGVLYCVEDGANGFNFENGKYKAVDLRERRFTLLLAENRAKITIEGDDWNYSCKPSRMMENGITCTDNDSYYFTFNKASRRFVLNNSYGFVEGDGDSVRTGIGTCSAF